MREGIPSWWRIPLCTIPILERASNENLVKILRRMMENVAATTKYVNK